MVEVWQFPRLKVGVFYLLTQFPLLHLNSWYYKWQFPLCLCATGERCGAPCTTEEFTCENGCCLDPGLECDKLPQCTDSSDEQKCEDCEQWLCKLGFIFIQAHGNIDAAMIKCFLERLTWIMSCVLISEQQLSYSDSDSSEWTKRWFELLFFCCWYVLSKPFWHDGFCHLEGVVIVKHALAIC